MEQSSFWEVNRSSAAQEIRRALWKGEGWLLHSNTPPPFPVLRQVNRVQAPLSHFLKIHFCIILQSTPRPSKWSLSLKSPHQNRVCTFPTSHTCHMPRPLYSSWFDHSLLHSPVTSFRLGSDIFLSNIFSKPLGLYSSLTVRDRFSHQYKIAVLYVLIFIFLDSRFIEKICWTKYYKSFPDFDLL